VAYRSASCMILRLDRSFRVKAWRHRSVSCLLMKRRLELARSPPSQSVTHAPVATVPLAPPCSAAPMVTTISSQSLHPRTKRSSTVQACSLSLSPDRTHLHSCCVECIGYSIGSASRHGHNRQYGPTEIYDDAGIGISVVCDPLATS
jgi:hypothetical protein